MKTQKLNKLQANVNSQNLLMNMVVHDMRTPTNCIQMSSEHLQAQIQQRLSHSELYFAGPSEKQALDFSQLKTQFGNILQTNNSRAIGSLSHFEIGMKEAEKGP